MQEDANRFFAMLYGTSISLEHQMHKCYKLIITNPKTLIPSNGGQSFLGQPVALTKITFWKNTSMEEFANTLDNMIPDMPVINGTGFTKNIDIELDFSNESNLIPSINQQLSKKGLTLIVAESEMEVMVIRENKI
ncbi:MAG: DUF3738 domain-containing protein [Chitinophagaceae bacterium]|nr:DUF3738 domain-containing protein [Chitinophagaceae bacterium]